MAGKLGALVIEIIANNARLKKDMGKAEKTVKRSTDKMARSARSATKALAAIGGVAAFGALARKVVRATNIQEAAVKQLEAGLASTGNVVGKSLEELTAKAAEFQNASTFGDEEIIAAQSKLVTFTNIVGDNFDRTTQAALDLSARMGTDLTSSVVQLGKALNDPVKNLSALSRSGIQFSKAQTDLIKGLVETGRAAEAQGIILKELDRQFGGSAAAARDTFGGALDGLSNAFGDLFEAQEGGLNGAKESLEELTAVLQDPATIKAAQDLIAAFIDGFGGVIAVMTAVTNLARGLGEGVAELISGGLGQDSLQESLAETEARIESLQEKVLLFQSGFGSNAMVNPLGFSAGAIEAELDALIVKRDQIQVLLDGLVVRPGIELNTNVSKELDALLAGELFFKADPIIIPTEIGVPKFDQKVVPPEVLENLRFINQLIADAKTPLENYEAAVARINALYETGNFSNEVRLSALKAEAEVLLENTPAYQAWLDVVAEGEAVFESTRTEMELYDAQLERLSFLLEEGVISAETYSRAVEQMGEQAAETGEELSVFADQAARNMQSAFADFLFDPFEKGLDGMLVGFLETIKKMVAEAAAAEIFKELGVEDFLKKGISSIFGGFGGVDIEPKALGGPVNSGQPYLVGEEGPELFVPKGMGGMIIPNGQLSGGGVVQNINVMAPEPAKFHLSASRAALEGRRRLEL